MVVSVLKIHILLPGNRPPNVYPSPEKEVSVLASLSLSTAIWIAIIFIFCLGSTLCLCCSSFKRQAIPSSSKAKAVPFLFSLCFLSEKSFAHYDLACANTPHLRLVWRNHRRSERGSRDPTFPSGQRRIQIHSPTTW